MNKDKHTYISNTLLKNEELTELDFELGDEFNHDYDGDGWLIEMDGNSKCKDKWYVNTTSVKIENLLELINKFKKLGATHIKMNHHGDHHGYEFSAMEVKLATEGQIEKYEAYQKLRKKKQKQIDKLRKEIERIQNSD